MSVPPDRLFERLREAGLVDDDVADAAELVERLRNRQVEPGETLGLGAMLAKLDDLGTDSFARRVEADWDAWARANAPELVGLLGATQGGEG